MWNIIGLAFALIIAFALITWIDEDDYEWIDERECEDGESHE